MNRIAWMLVIVAVILILVSAWSTCNAQVVLRGVVKPTGVAPPETTVVLDDFNRDGLGTKWTVQTGGTTVQEVGDSAIKNSNSGAAGSAYYNDWTPPDSQYAVVIIGYDGAGSASLYMIGPACRMSSNNDTSYYSGTLQPNGNWYVFRVIHGASSTMGSGDIDDPNNLDSLKLICKADSIIYWYNTTRLWGGVYSGANKLTSGKVGVSGYGSATINGTAWRGGKYTE